MIMSHETEKLSSGKEEIEATALMVDMEKARGCICQIKEQSSAY